MFGRIARSTGKVYLAAETGLSRLASAFIMAMMILTTADVMGRYLFKSPIIGVYELSEVLLVGMVYLGIAYVQSLKGHVKVEVVTSWMPQRVQQSLDMLGYLMGLFLMALIAWRSGVLAWIAWVTNDRTTGLVHFPLWPGKSAVTIGAGLMCLRLMSDIVRSGAAFFRGRQ